MSKLTPTKSTPQAWFAQGLTEHGEAKIAIQSIKTKAITAGYFFTQAKLALGHGNWAEFVESQSGGVSERTIQRYIGFYEDALVSVIAARRKFTDEQIKSYEPTPKELADPKNLEEANHVVVHSSLGFVDLCRELGLFRKFGEYDAVKHAAAKARDAKAGLPVQMTFDLGVAMAGLRSLAAIDTARVEALPPERLPELRDQLATALEKVTQRINTISVAEVEG